MQNDIKLNYRSEKINLDNENVNCMPGRQMIKLRYCNC